MALLRSLIVSAVLVLGVGACDEQADTAPAADDDDDGDARRDKRKAKPKTSRPRGSAMPLGSVRMKLDTERRYRTNYDTLVQVLALAATNGLPVSEVSDGMRVDAAPDGSILEKAGLKKDDVITHVNGIPILDAELMTKVYALFEKTPNVALTVRRGKSTDVYTYDVSRAKTPRSRRRVSKDIADGIKKTGEYRYELSDDIVDSMLENQAELMRSARILPDQQNGKVVGIRLFGIRSGTLLDLLGFKNGDRVEKFDGMDVSDPEKALEAYARARNKEKHVVEVNRKGKSIKLEYLVVEAKPKKPRRKRRPARRPLKPDVFDDR